MEDSLLQKQKKELVDLYLKRSKHSQYQSLPLCLEDLLNESELEIRARYEKERWTYISEKVRIDGKRILDIGGNSGFFSFEAAQAGALCVDYYEGNKVHAEFVKKAAYLMGKNGQINVYNEYYDFREEERRYDVVFLLNVLHHVGDDYGNGIYRKEEAKNAIISELNSMAGTTDYLVYQMGFNWMGNIDKGLFENGTKMEMINYIKEGIKGYWKIKNIGIAELMQKKVVYKEVNRNNIERCDRLGEFLNRPIFILKSNVTYV